MRPFISLLTSIDDDKTTSILYNYVEAVEKSGGIPIVLPCVEDVEIIKHFVSISDGFIFTGGKDIEPQRYNEDAQESCGIIHKYRDEFEFKVFNEVIKTKKPMLGICRGAQLINVCLGGTLYQDIQSVINTNIKHKQVEDKYSYSHEITVIENTPLYNLTETKRIKINSFHHQAIRKLGNGLKVMAIADDGIIEAIYSDDKRYIRAYQWHPERLFNKDKNNKEIFTDFISACRKY